MSGRFRGFGPKSASRAEGARRCRLGAWLASSQAAELLPQLFYRRGDGGRDWPFGGWRWGLCEEVVRFATAGDEDLPMVYGLAERADRWAVLAVPVEPAKTSRF